MLKLCSNVLLLSDVKSFSDNYRLIAEDLGVNLSVEEEWNNRYRIGHDLVICGSKYLEFIHPDYFSSVVLILKEDELPATYIAKGIERFIFNHKDNRELALSLYKSIPVVVRANKLDYEEVLKYSNTLNFCVGNYEFYFDRGIFKYKGQSIYLTDADKLYLAEWLLNEEKDNSKRMILCKLRKKFGDAFLRDIDRFGNLKEKKHE